MKNILKFLGIELLLAFIADLIVNNGHFNYDLITGLGICSFIGGIVFMIIALILLIAKNKNAKDVLISGAILLAIGWILFYFFPLHLRLGS